MSVIAARVYKNANKIVMASDSIMVKGWSKTTQNTTKLVSINGMIMGVTGHCDEASLMFKYMETHKPLAPTERDVLDFVVEFSQWKRDYSGDTVIRDTYLLAYGGHLFCMEGIFVYEVKEYESVGAGEDFAKAALYLGHSPQEAVKVACELSCFVCEPIVIYEQDIN